MAAGLKTPNTRNSALEAGTFDITLEVRANNHAAQAFYLALGYEPVGRIERYYQGVEDAIRLRRSLRVANSASASNAAPDGGPDPTPDGTADEPPS